MTKTESAEVGKGVRSEPGGQEGETVLPAWMLTDDNPEMVKMGCILEVEPIDLLKV